ncbi:MAG: dienelactone hydrolase family protein [Alphaproteobacteria bacterium]|nr:dienelactone hydrolase family protein [Alphaproteobacteria bacterium]
MNIARRDMLRGAASLPLAAILADPLIARAVAAGLDQVSTKTAGGKTVNASLALPARTPAPAVVLVHEWWGLNDQIKSVAAELAKEGYIGLAVDLYDGKVADKPEGAKPLMGAAMKQPKVAQETVAAWADWLAAHDQATGKIGTVGWCFGGGWSLNASLLRPVDATVIYYGSVSPEWGGVSRAPDALAKLKGPVLGHYATQDNWITKDMVAGFEARMKEADKPFTSHWYEAQHAFANPTQARYDEADAKTAWERTSAFFKQNLA